MDFFKRLKMVDEQGKKTRPPCFKGIVITIQALLDLWDDVNDLPGVEFLATRRLIQDGLENLFGVIRRLCGDNTNPTPAQFRYALKHAMVSSALGLHRPQGGNCELDAARFLLKNGTKNVNADDEDLCLAMKELDGVEVRNEATNDGTEISFSEKNVLYYFSGCCVNKYCQYHNFDPSQSSNGCSCWKSVENPNGKVTSGSHIFAHF